MAKGFTNGDALALSKSPRMSEPREGRGAKPLQKRSGPRVPTWQEQWEAYAKTAVETPWGRGDGDCCSLMAGWASLVSGESLDVLALTEEAAEQYLEALGGMEEALDDALRPLGYKVTDKHAEFMWGIVLFAIRDNPNPAFPLGVGVIVGDRIATRSERKNGISYIHPFRVEVLKVYNHKRIIKTWV